MKNNPKVDRPVAELQKAGFLIRPWLPAAAIAEMLGGPQRDMRMFEIKSVHGLLEIRPDALNIVALTNDRPGNGQFDKAVKRLESVADRLGVTFRIVEFWNDRLRAWFVRRGYIAGRSQHFGLYAERPFGFTRPTTRPNRKA